MKCMKQERLIYYTLLISAVLVFLGACNSRKPVVVEMDAIQNEVWTCSMHPEIIRDKPGNCPICGMEMVKKVDNATELTGIQFDQLLQPTNRFVVSSIPLTTLTEREFAPEIRSLGTITYDTRSINTISARVSGRIEKMYVQYRYQHVMKGERIMDIYSPEMVTAQQELLFLMKNDPENVSLIGSSRQKLLFLGLNENQLEQVIQKKTPLMTIGLFSSYNGHLHESGNSMPETGKQLENRKGSMSEELPIKPGMYVEKGQTLFQIFNTDKSWVLLNIFPEAQGLVKVGNIVEITPETDPGKWFRAKIDLLEPFYRNESKTLTARVYFDNSTLNIPSGSQVKATIFSAVTHAGFLPKESVLSLGYGSLVSLKAKGGFKAHKVETGISYQNQLQVLSGLDPTDSVAANAQYLMDSEGFIKTKN